MEITENKLKAILKEQREEYQIHIGALAEEFQSRLAAGLEPIISLTKSVNALAEIVAKLQENITHLQAGVSAMQEMIVQNTEDITIMKSDVQFIKQELKQKVSVEEFGMLEKRVLLLERRAAH